MIQKILGLILLTPATLAQMDSIRPDVRYTGDNDRFDLSGIVSAQNKMFRDTPLVDDDEDEGVASDADYRRQLHSENVGILLDALTSVSESKNIPLITHPAPAFPTRRHADKFVDDDKFAVDDTMNSFEGGTMSDFEDNLKHFQVNKSPSRRKMHDGEHAEHEILQQNVFPIVMKVDGYLKPPLQ